MEASQVVLSQISGVDVMKSFISTPSRTSFNIIVLSTRKGVVHLSMHKLFCWSAHEVLCSTSTALFSILQVQLVQLRRPSFSEKSRAILEPSIDSVSLKFLAEIGFAKSYLDKGRVFRRSAKAPIEHARHK